MIIERVKSIFEKHNGYVRTTDLLQAGINFYQIKKLVGAGLIIKIQRGLYYFKEIASDNELIQVHKAIPSGVFCLFSAWLYYELTDIVTVEYHIAIEKSQKIKLATYPPIKLYYWSKPYFELGHTKVEIEGVEIAIYNREKSVCDAVRFQNKIGKDTTIEVLKNYLELPDRNINDLIYYGKKLRIEQNLNQYLSILI